MKKLILVFAILLPALLCAQEEQKEDKITAHWSGFVKNDFFWDSRQTITAREGQFMLFPAPVAEDADGEDINDNGSFNFLAVQSRMILDISGPKQLGAELSAKISGDFFAQANDNINLFRLRHAFIKMKWPQTELLAGQYWIPMFVPQVFPGTVSFNTGTPFQPFGRNPQIRFTYTAGNLKFLAIASAQRDFRSRGPAGVTSDYLRNSGKPEFSGQVHVDVGDIYAGIGGSYKSIVPQLQTGSGYATDQALGSFNGLAFFKVVTKPLTFKFEGIYGQNIPDVLSIGGFGVSDSTDMLKGYVEYSPINTMSAWVDLHTNGKKWQYGIFGGYTQNMGAAEDIIGPVYGFATNIKSVYRVSPRVIYNAGQVRMALELEYTAADYGLTRDEKAVPGDLSTADNLRVLAALYYFFK